MHGYWNLGVVDCLMKLSTQIYGSLCLTRELNAKVLVHLYFIIWRLCASQVGYLQAFTDRGYNCTDCGYEGDSYVSVSAISWIFSFIFQEKLENG